LTAHGFSIWPSDKKLFSQKRLAMEQSIYPVLSMMGMPDTIAGIPVLPPRQLKDTADSLYIEGSTSFEAPPPGAYYYLCQYFDHARKGMYGRFIVTR